MLKGLWSRAVALWVSVLFYSTNWDEGTQLRCEFFSNVRAEYFIRSLLGMCSAIKLKGRQLS